MGLVRLDSLSTVGTITWVSPEIIMLCSSVTVLIVCKKLVASGAGNTSEEGEAVPKHTKRKKYGFLVTIGACKTLEESRRHQ